MRPPRLLSISVATPPVPLSFQAAVAAAHEEAAAALAAASEAEAKLELLQQQMKREEQQRELKRQATLELAHHVLCGGKDQDRVKLGDLDVEVLVETLKTQSVDLASMTAALEQAQRKQHDSAREAADLMQKLSEAEVRVRLLETSESELHDQVAALGAQLEDKERLLADVASRSPVPTSSCGDATASAATGSQRGSEPGHGLPGATYRRGGSSGGGAAHMPRIEAVVSAYKEALAAREGELDSMAVEMDAVRCASEQVRSEVAALTRQLAEAEAVAAAEAQRVKLVEGQLRSERADAAAQLRGKDELLAVLEARLAAAEADARGATARAAGLEQQVRCAEEELAEVRLQLGEAERRGTTTQEQLAALESEANAVAAATEQLRLEASHAVGQANLAQQKLVRQEDALARVLAQVRGTLTAAATASPTKGAPLPGHVLHLLDQSSAAGMEGSPGAVAVLEDLVDALVAELGRRGREAQSAAGEAARLEASLARKGEELSLAEGRARGQSERLAQVTAELALAREEVGRLQAGLRKKEADCAGIETEIQQQISDYQRLKARLLQQEKDSSRLSGEHEALQRRCDELTALLAAKAEEASSVVLRSSQHQEALMAAQQAAGQLAERVQFLEAALEAAQRSQARSMIEVQEASVGLETSRAELEATRRQLLLSREQVEKKNQEVRELNGMLKAWEAMRLGKDAQIAALTDKCKRLEEDTAEKVRTVDALRRKLTSVSTLRATAGGNVMATPATLAAEAEAVASSRLLALGGAAGIATHAKQLTFANLGN